MYQHQMTHSHHYQKVTVNMRRFQERLSKSVASMAGTEVTSAYEKTKQNKTAAKKKNWPKSQLESSFQCHVEQLIVISSVKWRGAALRRLATREE